jgi:hypothetical protein
MSDPNGVAQAILTDAATLLLAVGCADPSEVLPGVRLRCLSAAESLRSIGARPDRHWPPISGSDACALVLQARAALHRLPDDLKALPAITVVGRLLDDVLAEFG